MGVVLAAALLTAQFGGSGRASEDVVGWRLAHWGMTVAELDDAFGGALNQLTTPITYKDAYVSRVLSDVEIADRSFIALFQMAESGGALQQVLLVRPRDLATRAGFDAAVASLTAAHGRPMRACETAGVGGTARMLGRTWVFPTTTIHATFVDDRAPIITEDPFTDPDPLTNRERRQGYKARPPPRLALRYHPSARTDLSAVGACAPGGG